MPRRKRHEKISEYHLQRIERQVSLLEIAISEASLGMTLFCPHGEALAQLSKDLRTAVNLLNNRPADYLRHNGSMSPEQVAWHDEFERKARAMGREEEDDSSSSGEAENSP